MQSFKRCTSESTLERLSGFLGSLSMRPQREEGMVKRCVRLTVVEKLQLVEFKFKIVVTGFD